tara:strand:+ start:81 stop:233 length:153 start_codon:yes stop_codon:yes gene_type:complete
MIILSILKFFRKKKTVKKETVESKEYTESDFIDYDGMGNQGRFVNKKNKP